MSRIIQFCALALFAVLLTATTVYIGPQTSSDKQTARDSILSLVNQFRQAELELNSEKFIALNEQSPDYRVYTDNNTVLNYDQMARMNRRVFHRLKRMQFEYDTLHIRVLASDMGVAFAPFRQALTDSSDRTLRYKGQVLWITRRIAGQWKFVFAQAFHRPDTTFR